LAVPENNFSGPYCDKKRTSKQGSTVVLIITLKTTNCRKQKRPAGLFERIELLTRPAGPYWTAGNEYKPGFVLKRR